MKLTTGAATFAILICVASPAAGGPGLCQPHSDIDGDGVIDCDDNCVGPVPGASSANPAQDDTDGDDCGNICDGDFNNDGDTTVFELFDQAGLVGLSSPLHDMTEPIGVVGVFDLFALVNFIGLPAGPSETTTGTVACP